MKLKTVEVDGKIYAEIEDDKPIYIHADGKEVPFDAPATVATISRLNGEAKGHREAKEAAEERLQAFDGIEDAEAARKALETVKNLKDGELFTAGKVEEIKAAAQRAAEDQVAQATKASSEKVKALETDLGKITSQLYAEKVGGAFSRSRFIADKVAIPADLVRAQFGSRFKVEDGKIVAYDQSGNKVYSRAKPGEVAEFDEALEILVDAYPHRDAILKGSGGEGGGSRQTGAGGSSARTMTRAQFNELDPSAQMKAMTVDQIQIVD